MAGTARACSADQPCNKVVLAPQGPDNAVRNRADEVRRQRVLAPQGPDMLRLLRTTRSCIFVQQSCLPAAAHSAAAARASADAVAAADGAPL